jgi:hypothetical protein
MEHFGSRIKRLSGNVDGDLVVKVELSPHAGAAPLLVLLSPHVDESSAHLSFVVLTAPIHVMMQYKSWFITRSREGSVHAPAVRCHPQTTVTIVETVRIAVAKYLGRLRNDFDMMVERGVRLDESFGHQPCRNSGYTVNSQVA